MAAINWGYAINKPRVIDIDSNNLRKSDEILRESSQQASAMVKKAERVIEQERIKAHKELKDEVADLSVMIASKIVERDVKPEDHERFIEDFIDKVG